MKTRRYLRIARIFAGASLSAQMEYRANFLISVLVAVASSAGALLGLVVLYSDGQPLGGWSHREALVVVGLFTAVDGAIGAFLRPNLDKIAEGVRTGTMDFTLLKPVDSQFVVSTRSVNIFGFPQILLGLGLIVWAVAGIPSVSATGILVGILLILAGLSIVYSVWFMLCTTAFWFVKVENITELFNGLFRAGQFPVSAFPGWARVFFSTIAPVAFITTVPAEALVGRVQPRGALIAITVAALLALVSRQIWQYAVRSYTSASS